MPDTLPPKEGDQAISSCLLAHFPTKIEGHMIFPLKANAHIIHFPNIKLFSFYCNCKKILQKKKSSQFSVSLKEREMQNLFLGLILLSSHSRLRNLSTCSVVG